MERSEHFFKKAREARKAGNKQLADSYSHLARHAKANEDKPVVLHPEVAVRTQMPARYIP